MGPEQRGNNEDAVRRDRKVKILLCSLLGSASFGLICNGKMKVFLVVFGNGQAHFYSNSPTLPQIWRL